MQLTIGDFPSDIHGETYNLRPELLKCLQRACTSETGSKVLKDVVKFSISKLKEADLELAEYVAKRDYVEPEVPSE